MGRTLARRGGIFTTVLAAILLAVSAVAWACTMPVGGTTVTPPAGAPGDEVTAVGVVANSAEHLSRCTDGTDAPHTAECTYEFGIVDPAQVENGNAQGDGDHTGHSASCHYETPRTWDSGDPKQLYQVGDTTHTPSDDQEGVRVLEATGPVPDFDSEESGETVACFYSDGTDGDGNFNNGQDNGAAAATLPTPFVVLAS